MGYGKNVLREKRLFQFIIEKATNYTYVGLSNHRNVFGVDIKILKMEISVTMGRMFRVVRKLHYLPCYIGYL